MPSHKDLSVYQAIYQRRMAWRFKPDRIPSPVIDQLLDAAVWAPNHRLTEPWRFFVLEQDSPARIAAAQLAHDAALERSGDTRRAEAARQKILAPPFVIYVYSVPGHDEDTTRENYAAVCCAVQNMALAGAAEGLAVTWETGGAVRHPGLKAVLGADESWELVTALLIGYAGEYKRARRTAVSNFVTWSIAEAD